MARFELRLSTVTQSQPARRFSLHYLGSTKTHTSEENRMPTVIGGTPGVGGIIPGKTISTYQGSGGDGPSSLTRDEYNDLSLRTFNRVNNSNAGVSAWEHIARYGAGVAIDTADT